MHVTMSAKNNADLIFGVMIIAIIITVGVCINVAYNDATTGEGLACLAAAVTSVGGLQVLHNFTKN